MTLPPYHLLLTGGTGAISLAIAKHFAALRSSSNTSLWRITLVSRSSQRAQSALDALRPHSLDTQQHASVVGDVGHAEFWTRLTQRGGAESIGAVTALVNAAGVVRRGALARMSVEDIQSMVDTNLTGTILAARLMLRPLLEGKRSLGVGDGSTRSPSIVNVSSLLASHGGAGAAVYAAAKAGVVGRFCSCLLRMVLRAIRSHKGAE
jgi:NAD(P)-dependent dehydrogenase (short-subunit alcohol dehydrogenase family)